MRFFNLNTAQIETAEGLYEFCYYSVGMNGAGGDERSWAALFRSSQCSSHGFRGALMSASECSRIKATSAGCTVCMGGGMEAGMSG